MKGVVTDTACSSVCILRTPGDVSRASRDGTTPRDRDIVVRSPKDNVPVLIGGIVVPPTMGHSGNQEVISKQQSISPSVIRNAQNFDTSVDGNLACDGYSKTIFRKILGR